MLSLLRRSFCTTPSFLQALLQQVDYKVLHVSTEEPDIPVAEFEQLQASNRRIQECFHRGEWAESLGESQVYLQNINSHYGTHHPSFLSALNNMGLLYKKMNQLENSLLIFQKVSQGYSNLFGEKHRSTLISKQNYANTLRQAGHTQEAVSILEQALSSYGPPQGEQDCHLKTVLMASLAGCLIQQDQHHQAQQVLSQAINQLEQVHGPQKLGEKNLLFGLCYNNLGLSYKKQESFLMAEEYYQKALKIRQTHLKADHPDLVQIAHNLGELYLAQGQAQESNRYFQMAAEGIRMQEDSFRANK